MNIESETFKKICQESLTMAEASRKLQIPFSTFKVLAKKHNCYKPNASGKGTEKIGTHTIPLNEILEGLHPTYHSNALKKRLIKKGIKKAECEECHLTEWLNNPIPLELHHKDGNDKNHKLENLKILCPNCHALTPSYRRKKTTVGQTVQVNVQA